jgi:filamentous hemagglutinin family protein
MRQLSRAIAGGVALILTTAASGQVKTDGSLGARQTPPGPHFAIPASLGQTRGANLFHSFEQFDIPTGGSATFSGPASVHNVLARVTGGQPSQIDGRLACDIDGANLYLINPAGLVFGANATLDLRGSFVATTADVLHLKDGGKFRADTAPGSVLTSAPPSAFGFLARPGPPPQITFNGGAVSVPNTKVISLVAGSLDIKAQEFYAVDGRLNLIAAAPGATVTFDPASPDGDVTVDRTTGRGPIAVMQGSLADVSGDRGGRITVNGGAVDINEGSTLQTTTLGDGPGRGIDVDAQSLRVTGGGFIGADSAGPGAGGPVSVRSASLLEIDDAASGFFTGITTHALSTGRGGDLTITAGNFRITANGSLICSSTDAGPAGTLTVSAASLRINNGGGISGNAQGAGRAADVRVNITGDLTIDGGFANVTTISSESLDFGSEAGAAGNIDISARTLNIFNAGTIDTSTLGKGRGGRLTVNVARALTIDGGDSPQLTGILSDSVSSDGGPGGDISVAARAIRIANGGQISTTTNGVGNAGALSVSARRDFTIDGGGSAARATGIFSQTNDLGRGGDLTINAGALTMIGGGQIDDSTFAAGDAGRITLNVPGALRLDLSGIFSNSAIAGGGGKGGGIAIHAGSVELLNFGQIDAGTFGNGPAGELVLTADTVRIAAGGLIRTRTLGAGPAGPLTVNAGTLDVSGGGAIDASTSGAGAAGELTLTATSINVGKRGLIRARTTGDGAGGRLTVNARNTLTIDAGGIFSDSTATTPDAGAGGDVSVDAADLLVRGPGTISAASAAAPAGTVTLSGRTVNIVDGGSVTVRSERGPAGDIVVHASESFSLLDQRPGIPTAIDALKLDVPPNSSITARAVHGDGGNITLLTPGRVTVVNSLITARAAGVGAAITIDPPVVILRDSVIDGKAGTSARDVRVTIDRTALVFNTNSPILSTNRAIPPPVDISGSLVAFNATLADDPLTLAEQCPRHLDRSANISSFLILGRGGTPEEPGGLNPSFDPGK